MKLPRQGLVWCAPLTVAAFAACGPAAQRAHNTAPPGDDDAAIEEPADAARPAVDKAPTVENDGPPAPPPGDVAPPPVDLSAPIEAAPIGACGAITGAPITKPMYVAPPAGFTLAMNEMTADLAFDSRPLTEVQAAIDAARAKDATTLIRVQLKGSISVSTTPLRLPSRTTLTLAGTLTAAAGATAPSLISVDAATFVGISGGTLDAGGKVAAGIAVNNSGHVHIDHVTISGATGDDLHFVGTGATSTDAGSSITRVDASGAHGNGIAVSAATNVIVMDVYSHDNMGAGLVLDGAFGMAVNNRLRANGSGLVSAGTSNLLYRNVLDCNMTGLAAAAASDDDIVIQNRFGGNGKDVTLDGKENVLYGNQTPQGIDDGGMGNFVLGNDGPFRAGGKSANQVFLPPTLSNRHKDPVTPGQPRVDLTMTPQNTPDLAAALAKARTDHPGATLVVDLQGNFSTGALTLTSDTVLLIEGTLKLTGGGSLVSGMGLHNVALEGGTLDCGGQAQSAVTFDAGAGVVLDGVKTTGCTSDTIHFSHGRPNIVHATTVSASNKRCVWAQSLSRLIVVDSSFSGCTMDGIDMDSHDQITYSLGNHTFDNKRYGVFFEEGGKHNVAVANLTERNGKGVNVYSNASPGTDYNLVVANTVTANSGQGLRAGALPMMDTSSNYFFNNVVSGNASGIYQDGAVKLNYFSQNVLMDNKTQVVDMAGNLVFFNPP